MASIRSLFRSPVASAASRTFSTTARANYAKTYLIGRLTAAPELKAGSTGKDFIKYVLATNHGPRENQRSSFWNVVSFPATSGSKEYLLGLPKGSLVHLEADTELMKFTDDEGRSRNTVSLIQQRIEVIARPKPREFEDNQSEPEAASG